MRAFVIFLQGGESRVNLGMTLRISVDQLCVVSDMVPLDQVLSRLLDQGGMI